MKANEFGLNFSRNGVQSWRPASSTSPIDLTGDQDYRRKDVGSSSATAQLNLVTKSSNGDWVNDEEAFALDAQFESRRREAQSKSTKYSDGSTTVGDRNGATNSRNDTSSTYVPERRGLFPAYNRPPTHPSSVTYHSRNVQPNDMGIFDHLSWQEEQEEREGSAQNSGRNKLYNIVNQVNQGSGNSGYTAEKYESQGWEVINRDGPNKRGTFEPPRRKLPQYGFSYSGASESSSSSADKSWSRQLHLLKQQKAEAREKASTSSDAGSVESSASDYRKRKHPGDVDGAWYSGIHRTYDGGEYNDEAERGFDEDPYADKGAPVAVKRTAPANKSVTGAIDLKQFMPTSSKTSSSRSEEQPAATAMKWGAGSIEAIKAAYQNSGASGSNAKSVAESLADVNIDPLLATVLSFRLAAICAEVEDGDDGPGSKAAPEQEEGEVVPAQLPQVPIRFLHEDHYVSTFRPLLMEEAKAAIGAHLLGISDGGSDGRGSKGHGRQQSSSSSSRGSTGEFKVVAVKCQSRANRTGSSAVEEVQVSTLRGGGGDSGGGGGSAYHGSGGGHDNNLQKDDLVMVMAQAVPAGITRYRDLIKQEHTLVLVCTSAKYNSSTNQPQQTLLVPKRSSSLPDGGSTWYCVPVMGLSSFMREWLALHSISSHTLMPLAPYILKGSPVVSSTYLSGINEKIAQKVQNMTSSGINMGTAERRQRFNDALLLDLASLLTVQVDGSVLKNTGIAKTLLKINHKAGSNVFSEPCLDLAGNLVARWKEQIKNDNKVSTIQNMKGGKLVEMPASGEIERPRCIPGALWRKLCSSYNVSQLFAIKYVSDQFEGGQDTRVALVQGPPGTGKTSTILGMVSALLHRTFATQQSPANSQEAFDPVVMPLGLSCVPSRVRLLICAPSNGAVDEILTRLSTNGVYDARGDARPIKIVRLGEPLEGAPPLIRALTLDHQVDTRLEQDPMFLKLQDANKLIREIETELNRLEPPAGGAKSSSSSSASAKYHAVDWKLIDVANQAFAPTAADKEKTAMPVPERVKKLKADLATQRQVRTWAETGVERVRNTLRHTIMLEADVVSGTLSGSGRQQFLDHIVREDVIFDTAIIDEAAQTTEPSTLIPLKFGCRRLVLVGDPRQLPATVLSRKAERAGLGLSLFERLERANHEVVMLTIQYRMHPEIRLFPSQTFYQGKLVDSSQIQAEVAHYASQRTYVGEAVTPYSNSQSASCVVSPELLRRGIAPVTFYDVYNDSGGGGCEVRSGKSYRNDTEARYLLSLLERIHNAESSGASGADSDAIYRLSIGIITPYKAQVRLLRDLMRNSATVQEIQKRRREVAGGGEDLSIEVNSIDGFQGREKDIILFSCVRSSGRHSNSHHDHRGGGSQQRSIGFVADERRMNVALTRSKKALLIAGDCATLKTDSLWASLLQSMKERGLVVDSGKRK